MHAYAMRYIRRIDEIHRRIFRRVARDKIRTALGTHREFRVFSRSHATRNNVKRMEKNIKYTYINQTTSIMHFSSENNFIHATESSIPLRIRKIKIYFVILDYDIRK